MEDKNYKLKYIGMRKLIILMFVALGAISAMAATDYGIKVNGTSITSDNLRFTIGSGGVAYDESSNTLTLSSVSITRTGSGNHALRVYANSNRSSNELTININGNSTLIAGNADAVVLEATTKFVVMGSTSLTIGTAASGQYAVRVYNNADVEFHGPGSLTIAATDGVAVKGEGGNEYARFYIKNCTLQGKRGNFVKLGRVSINPYNSSLTQSTTITLSPTKSSSYPHTQDVSSYYYGANVHLASPEGASFPDLATASNYSKTYVFNDEHDNPNLTTVGNFQYDTYTLNGETYARLRNPTVAFRHTYPSYIEVPGYVTLNGVKRHVMVGTEAFRELNSVTSIRLNYGVGAIGNVAFRMLPNLSSVFIPSSVKSIENTFLSECGATATNGTLSVLWATLDPSAVTLGDNAFAACHADTRRVILPTLPAISKANSISKITQNFTVSSTPSPRSSCDIYTGNSTTSGYGYIVTTPGSSSVQPKAALVHSAFAHVVINNNYIGYDGYLGLYIYCDNVAEQAFKYNSNVDALTVSNSDVTINKEAFYGCTKMTSATLNAKIIREDAFYGCTSLSTATLNEGVQQVNSRAFQSTAITTLNIPATLTLFAVTAVSNCKKLERFTVASGNSTYSTYSTYGALYNKSLTQLVKVPAYNAYTAVAAFAPTLTSVFDYAFADNCRASYVELPYGVTSVGTSAGYVFSGSTSIESVKIPSSVTSINYTNMFYDCTRLKKILISTYANRKNVNVYTFYNVPSSMTVYVPSCWDTPDNSSSAAYYTDDIWKSYTVTYGAWDILSGGIPYFINSDKSTASVVRGTYIYASGSDYNMLKSGALNIYETFNYNGKTYTITGISRYAFMNNTALTSLSIPATVTRIEDHAFDGCSGLTSIEPKMTDPASLNYGGYIFNGVNKQTCKLTVPAGTLSKYKTTYPWSAFYNIEQDGVFGDLNDDGFVNTGDVSVLYQAILSGSTDALYDLNGDGNVNTGDVSTLYSLIIGG